MATTHKTHTAGEGVQSAASVLDTLFIAGDRVYLVAVPELTGTIFAVCDGRPIYAGPVVRVAWDGATSTDGAWYPVSDLEYWTRPEAGVL